MSFSFKLCALSFFLSLLMLIGAMAQAGKIAGRVTAAETGDALIGANVLIEGSTMGAATDEDGFYFIINIPPGTYTVKVMEIGFATMVKQKVEVNINQTTALDFEMKQEAISGEMVVVEAQRPVIQMDVSSSQKIVTAQAIEERPLSNLEEILATEAGITLTASADGSGLLVRGGGLNETDIVVDGLSTRNERNQQPMTTINLTAVKEIEVLTGGFNAEYGDIRSGMISVVSTEGSLNKYSAKLDSRLSPAARKHFGPSPFSTEGPFWQVYAGPDAFTGVTQEMVDNGQYPFTFPGWNEVARQFLSDPDPSNDITPQEGLEIWKWQHRIRKYADKPDYILDGTLSGPVPGTPVAFMISQRYENLQLVYPLSRNNSIASSTLLKFTTHITPQMKISFNNSYILQRGVSGSMYEDTNGMITGTRQGTEYAQNYLLKIYMWHNANFNPIETRQYRGGITLNHVISSKMFYDLSLEYVNYKTTQEPIGNRDTTGIKKIGNKWYDEAPWGYYGSDFTGSVTERYDILQEFLMSGGGRGRDHSKYNGFKLAFDFVSQFNRHNEVKSGISLSYNYFQERREINHSYTTQPFDVAPQNWWYYNARPLKLGIYVQDKLEYKGMIANLGLRADYLAPGVNPFNLDPNFIFSENPYTNQNFEANGNSFDEYRKSSGGYKLYWSPRLGVSHPVTSTSKIFFNYGHFFQPPVNDRLYAIKGQTAANSALIPNLDANWPKTISYEIGIEKSFSRDYLLRFMGYYKDVSNQLAQQDIISYNSISDVSTTANNSYADIRGLELRLEKRVGRWWYGWMNLEYSVRSTGFTGLRYIYEDRQKAKLQAENTNQDRGWPVPSVNFNITFTTPRTYGMFLGDWRFTWLQDWSDGGKTLLNPDSPLNEQHYAGVIDYWNTDILLEKRFEISQIRMGVFLQVYNLFNYKGIVNPQYWNSYVASLHFPWEQGAQKGNDKIGDYKQDYINIGWYSWNQWINPRDIFFGLRFQL